MATQALNLSLNLQTEPSVSGIFSLNKTITNSVNFSNTDVSSSTHLVPTAGFQIVAATGGSTKVVYTYIKNTDLINFVELQNAAGNAWGKLLPGEWGFFPVADVVGLKAVANTADCICEFAIFESP